MISAELVLAVGGMILLVIPHLRSSRLLGLLTLALLAGAFDLKLLDAVGRGPLARQAFSGMLAVDRLADFAGLAVLFTMMLVVLSAMGYARQEVRARREFYALLLFSAAGLTLLVSARHLFMIYLSLELVSVLSYLLTAFRKRDSLSVEAGLKYFLFGALSTGAMLYGITLLYGMTGTMDLAGLAAALPRVLSAAPALASAALLLLLVGLAFKVALVPFHFWAPDAYEGAPTPVASFLSLAPKLAGFAALARFLLALTPAVALWPALLGLLAVLTMTVGNLVALVQTNVKRLLAYSSIAHAGTLVIGLAVATPQGLQALLYYLVAYLLMNAGAFAAVIAVGNAAGREDLEAFSGLSERAPALAFMMAIMLLSLAGIPPLAGFFGKLWIFAAAIQAGAVWLAVVAALNSVIALFYYARILQAMYLTPAPAAAPAIPPSRPLTLTLALCTLGLFAVGLWQGPWLTLAADSLPLPMQPADLPWMETPSSAGS